MTTESPVLLPFDEVKRRVGLSRSLVFDLIARGEFPRPVRVTAKRVAFVETEISDWIRNRIAASRADALPEHEDN